MLRGRTRKIKRDRCFERDLLREIEIDVSRGKIEVDMLRVTGREEER